MLEVRKLSKSAKTRKILDNINLKINSGEVTFIIGTSGAGKTTLLNVLGGLDKYDKGSIYLDGEDIYKNIDAYRAEHVGFVFQDYNLISRMSVRNNIKAGMYYAGYDMPEEMQDKYEHFNIKDIRQSSETLSGGEKQRVAILRSICRNCDVILADEPTGSLDSQNAILVYDELVKLKDNRHIVIISHDLDMAKKYADRIITLKDGKVIEDTLCTETEHEKHNYTEQAKEKRVKKRKLKADVMVAWNNIKSKCLRIIATSFVLGFAISAVLMALLLNDWNSVSFSDMNLNFLEADLIHITYAPGGVYDQSVFTDEDIQELENKYDIKEVVPLYVAPTHMKLTNDIIEKEADIKQINRDEFFEKRIMSEDIEGEFLSDKYDMIIAKDLAEELFENGDCIGKKIKVRVGSFEDTEYTIVGINSQINANDTIYTYIDASSLQETLEKNIKTMMDIRFFIEAEDSSHWLKDYACGHVEIMDGNETLLYGRKSQSPDEVYVSKDAMRIITKDKIDLEEYFNSLADVDTLICYNGVFEVKVVGVVESDTLEIKCQQELYDKMCVAEPNKLQIYVENTGESGKIAKSINEMVKYSAKVTTQQIKDRVLSQNYFNKKIIWYLGVALLIASVLMITSFIRISVMERRYEIGIVKSLGAGKGHVMFILWLDALAISIVTAVFIGIILKLMMFGLPYIFDEMSVLQFAFPFKNYFISLGIMFIFISVNILLGTVSLVKSTCAKLLRSR